MILDSSALIAMLYEEPEAPAIEAVLARDPACAIAAPTLLEACLVTEGRGGAPGAARLDALLARLAPEIVPFTAEHAALAREGWRRYGKGRHAAGLNLGDCFAYALAKARNQPLLFKGDDSSQTDVKAAL
ncbi:MAG: type II toxin-antitoxin system VapC family toxin [Rubritepida sp.]|nr:type II toxin-antitoxin system VapC family toxin [Rubritepida sp.]